MLAFAWNEILVASSEATAWSKLLGGNFPVRLKLW